MYVMSIITLKAPPDQWNFVVPEGRVKVEFAFWGW